MLGRLSTVAAPGSYQVTPRHHTATAYSTVSSQSLALTTFSQVTPYLLLNPVSNE
jgi:hypothetical protein